MTGDRAPARQDGFDIRFDWGLAGIEVLAESAGAVVIIDVLSFSTCVDVAVSAGAEVYPYRYRDPSAQAFAESIGALCAGSRSDPDTPYSLSPPSLTGLSEGTRLVLPLPNGATLSLATGDRPTFVGCLRNAAAVAGRAAETGGPVCVIAAGERWPDGSLRPAVEDLVGAGAVIAGLPGRASPEARLATATFRSSADDGLATMLADSVSGRELTAAGFAGDVEVASQLDVSDAAPRLTDGAFRAG